MRHEQAQQVEPPPLLHDQLASVSAPTQAWSHRDGTMDDHPIHGLFHGDWRFARRVELRVDGAPIEHLATSSAGDWALIRGIARALDSEPGDARIAVERMREVTPGAVLERATVVNGRELPIDVRIELAVDVAFCPIERVRDGRGDPVPVHLAIEGADAIATDGIRTLRVRSRGGAVELVDGRVVVSHRAIVQPNDWCGLSVELLLDDASLAVEGAIVDAPSRGLEPTGRPALDRWGERAVADLEDLLLDVGSGPVLAAGAPWRLTMVARDALSAARLLLPLGTSLAEATLRTLAARQGVQHDGRTGEQPGRMMHELSPHRPAGVRAGAELPPTFTDSIDATPLWIVLLHDAWRAGLPLEAVRELRTALHAALGWLGQQVGDGFLTLPGGDVTVGDGPELPRDAEGEPAEGPVATARLQALACRAAVGGAALLEALGDDGAPWLEWAERLRRRFRAAFWVVRGDDRHPAMAIDGTGGRLDWLSADLAHLIGSTLLSRDEERTVAGLLLDERLSSGFGLRSIAVDAPGYWPLAWNGGAIRPHDTAVAIEGLLRAGLDDVARRLAEQLERAAEAFDGSLPERYAGYGLADASAPVPLPGAGAPNARSAAAVAPVWRALGDRRAEHAPRRERHLHAVEPLPTIAVPAEAASGGTRSTSGDSSPRRAHVRLIDGGRTPSI
ncbi:glycogen debranching N-terminal domain-containing protein [Agrococcus sp. Marseille-Q4369]|uniref:glycogen debranching N-terminal domain-containing protein n=1 Tax=Agrococcus sp. Marseille-Q4369 TaxID=2810513 RepID=UPI001B8B6CAF|nr:glycogen debranching N-terminal domain-containing protein [Agrococcus sp. Marseille-Q4369]QUW18038.1 amylo-alpha-1,6-glucosidase [Agrococcus sp. Marseille-Q4369]